MANLLPRTSPDLATALLSQDHHTSIVSAKISDLIIEALSGEGSDDTPTDYTIKAEMRNNDELALKKGHPVEDLGLDVTATKDQPDISTTTLSYNTGYGDFCFGTDYDRQSMKFYYDSPYDKRNKNADVGSGINFVELDGYQRFGEFPFFNLPKEIRHKIFTFLVSPYVSGCSAPCTNIWLKKEYLDFSWKEEWINTYEKTHGEVSLTPATDSEDLSVHHSSVKSLRQEVYETKMAIAKFRQPHPDRTPGYHMRNNISKPNDDMRETDYAYLDWFRKISHTSRLFRNELGEAFWMRSEILADGCYPLTAFLQDRPMIMPGIKSLVLEYDATTGSTAVTSSQPTKFSQMCQFLGEHVVLESFDILIQASERQFEGLLKPGSQLSYLTNIRSIPVRQSFKLHIILSPGVDGWEPDGERLFDEEKKWHKKYDPLLKDFLLPETLRPHEPTAIQKYLQSRIKLLEESPTRSEDSNDDAATTA